MVPVEQEQPVESRVALHQPVVQGDVYQERRISTGKAAELLGIGKGAFARLLARKASPISTTRKKN